MKNLSLSIRGTFMLLCFIACIFACNKSGSLRVAPHPQSGRSGALSINSDSTDTATYFSFTFKDVTATFTNPDTVYGQYIGFLGQLIIQGRQIQSGVYTGVNVQLYLNSFTGVGTYPIYNFMYTDTTLGNNFFGVGAHCTITQYDPVGGYIVGTLSGSLWDQSPGAPGNSFQPISGGFKVVRVL